MNLVWDEKKRKSNLQKHGIDFGDADEFDFDTAIEFDVTIAEYDELRFKAIGPMSNAICVIVYTYRIVKRKFGLFRYDAQYERKLNYMCATKTDKHQNARKRALKIARDNLANMSDRENDKLTAAALGDADNLPLTRSQFEKSRPGRPFLPLGEKKVPITIRLDQDVVAHFKAGGKGWQSAINAALRKAAKI